MLAETWQAGCVLSTPCDLETSWASDSYAHNVDELQHLKNESTEKLQLGYCASSLLREYVFGYVIIHTSVLALVSRSISV